MRSFAFGMGAGALLSAFRAWPGLQLASFLAVDARLNALLQAAALFVIAACAARRGDLLDTGNPTVALLFGAAMGFLLHAFAIECWLPISTPWGYAASLVVAVPLMALGPAPRHWRRLDSRPAAPGVTETAGIAIAAGAAAIALSSISRPLGLLSAGLHENESMFAVVLLLCSAFGAVAFGGLLADTKARALLLPVALLITCAACVLALNGLVPLSGRGGLDRFLRFFEWPFSDSSAARLDLSLWSTPIYDAVIAARCFIAPGLVLGAALCGASSRAHWIAALAGGAIGCAVAPSTIDLFGGSLGPQEGHCASLILPVATLIAGIGCAIALVPRRPGLTHVRFAGSALVLGCMAIAWFASPASFLILSPWEQFAPRPTLVLETGAGLFTVEPARGGEAIATLNRQPLTPSALTREGDEDRLKLAFELLPKGSTSSVSVLHVGLLSPSRATAYARLGVKRIDRTASFHAEIPALEAALFGEAPLPAGSVVSPRQAARALREGRYDLVLAPAGYGREPLTCGIFRAGAIAAPQTQIVAWLSSSSFTARRRWSEEVLLWADPVEGLAAGLLTGGEESATEAPIRVPAGEPRRRTIPLLRPLERPIERALRSHVDFVNRLSEASSGKPSEMLVRGLAKLFAAQARSSPWDTPEQAVELDEGALADLSAAAVAAPKDPTVQQVWGALADVMVHKRAVEEIQRYIGPIAEASGFSVRMERALAHADAELLDPAMAAWRMLRILEVEPYDLDLRMQCAMAQIQAGDPAGALEQLDFIEKLAGDYPGLARLRALASARAGEPDARELIERWLEAHPEDDELRAYLEPGPLPELKETFTPNWSPHFHEEPSLGGQGD